MSPQAVLLPIFVQVALTFALLLRLGSLRVGLVRAGQVRSRDTVLGKDAWPERVRLISNSFDKPVPGAGAVLCSDCARPDHPQGGISCS